MECSTDTKIRAWQERVSAWQARVGIKVPTGDRLENLIEMSLVAHELIQIIDLLESGIRHGDGQWAQPDEDPLDASVMHIVQLLEREKEFEKEDQLLALPEQTNAMADEIQTPIRVTINVT